MAALGELFVLVIYLVLGSYCIWCFVAALRTRKNREPSKIKPAIISGLLLLAFALSQNRIKEDDQLNQVGKYYLTKYPNCQSCYIELLEDRNYKVIRKGEAIKVGDWHFESGGDYWITYLNGKRDQLGNGVYSYDKSELKNPR